jgi:hypothetical protein
MKVLVTRPEGPAPDFGIPTVIGVPPRYEDLLREWPSDVPYVVVRECWDDTTAFSGPLTQAEVDALPECSPDPDDEDRRVVSSITEDFRDAIADSDPSRVRPDIALLRAYQGIPSPTGAQTVAAVRAQSRLIAALARRLAR